jgi:hypothetical protein
MESSSESELGSVLGKQKFSCLLIEKTASNDMDQEKEIKRMSHFIN